MKTNDDNYILIVFAVCFIVIVTMALVLRF
jgi:hypothetical protein